jgi:hypothetical protein
MGSIQEKGRRVLDNTFYIIIKESGKRAITERTKTSPKGTNPLYYGF